MEQVVAIVSETTERGPDNVGRYLQYSIQLVMFLDIKEGVCTQSLQGCFKQWQYVGCGSLS